MFGIERRKHFRFDVEVPARLGPVGCGPDGQLGARARDLSLGGACLTLDGLPDWKFSEVFGGRTRLSVELDLGKGGQCLFAARPVRVSAGSEGCEVAVRFVAVGAAERARLGGFLERYREQEAGDAVRRRFDGHSRRLKRQRIAVAALFVVTGIALTFVVLSLAEAVPGWMKRGQEAIRGEVRKTFQDERHRLRDAGIDPRELIKQLSPEERGRLKRLLEEEDGRR